MECILMSDYYKLDNKHNVVPCELIEFGIFMKDHENVIVKQEHIGEYHISTVFLGLDHSFRECDAPLVFETMVFDGPQDYEYQTRCSTWDGALDMHKKACNYVRDLRRDARNMQ
jgi:hypothetical protein